MFIIFLLLVLNAEAYQKYLDTFTDGMQYIRFEYSEDCDWDGFCNSLIKKSVECKTEVLAVNGKFDEYNVYHIIIYASDKARDTIENKYHIKSNTYNSFFSGKTIVEFMPIEAISENYNLEQFYFYGEKTNIERIHYILNEQYGTSFLKKDSVPNDNWIVPLAWLGAGLFLVLLTLFDIAFQRKENFIRISLGKSIMSCILENIGKDTISFLIIFVVEYIVLKKYIYLNYHMKQMIMMLCILLCINILMYMSMLHYNMKMALSNGNYSESFCGNCYIVKVFIMLLAILSLSSNITTIQEGIQFLMQNKQIEKYQDYSFLELNYYRMKKGMLEQYDYYLNCLLQENYDALEIALTVCGYDDGESGTTYITVNDRAQDVIARLLEVYKINDDKKLHIFIPSSYKEKEEECLDGAFSGLQNLYTNAEQWDYDIVYYEQDVSVLYFDEDMKLYSGYANNPIIAYCTLKRTDFEGEVSSTSAHIGHECRSIMYKVSEEAVEKLEEKYDMEKNGFYLTRTSVTDRYRQLKLKWIRNITMNTAISTLLMILELAVIWIIIRLEYSINAIELALKKVFGYSVWKKNKRSVGTILYTNLLGTAIVTTMALMFSLANPFLVLLTGIGLSLFELIITWCYVNYIETKNVSKILKGGAL